MLEAGINDDSRGLEANTACLKQQRGLKFTIEGHCDEQGSAEYNLGLGDRRANRVRSSSLKKARINTITYGKERPVCREANEECYQKNRCRHFCLVLSVNSGVL